MVEENGKIPCLISLSGKNYVGLGFALARGPLENLLEHIWYLEQESQCFGHIRACLQKHPSEWRRRGVLSYVKSESSLLKSLKVVGQWAYYSRTTWSTEIEFSLPSFWCFFLYTRVHRSIMERQVEVYFCFLNWLIFCRYQSHYYYFFFKNR